MLYRDIASLQAMGAQIEGEPGLGYVLKPSFLLPPLMSLAPRDRGAGARPAMGWAAHRRGDGTGGPNVMAKVAAVLSADLRERMEATTPWWSATAGTGRNPSISRF